MITVFMKTQWLIGIDEAGRGPLAGPVYVGVFAIPVRTSKNVLCMVDDSKKIPETKRKAVFEYIMRIPNTRCIVTYTTATVIDVKGIVYAVNSAVQRGLRKLNMDPSTCTVLLDGGLHAPKEYVDQKTIIKGDQKEKVIGAASILAKVARDKKMCHVAQTYPKYGFNEHKGYGTKKHRDVIQKYGLSPIHRKTFCKNCV